MHTTALHPDFGIEITGIDLREVTADAGYPEIRALFERQSLLVFPGQHLDDAAHLALAGLFGPVEDRRGRTTAHMSHVSNLDADGRPRAADHLKTLDLKANMLWHTDSTFLPVPALANLAQARVVVAEGGATEFASTRAGWARLPERERARLRGAAFRHRLAQSRARIDPELARQPHVTKWSDQVWRAVWPNPVTGDEALYIASHVAEVEGMEAHAGLAWVDALIERMTPPEAVYSHRWREGDLLIWDERATLHRGTPWDYARPRVLASVCVSAGAADGLDEMRVR